MASGLKLSLQTAVLAIVFAAVGHAEDNGKAAVSEQDLQAKIHYCNYCHQPSGQGYLGAMPIPRLAGQQLQYFENQLKAYMDHRRANPVMVKVARSLDPNMLTPLATHFKDLNPKPLGGAPRELVDAGKKIFEQGIPDAKVPPCSTCHGPEAKGNGPFPRLAGQLYPYVVLVLTNFDKEHGPGGPEHAIMKPIAHSLTESQIKAVAAYLSYLE